LNPNTAPLLVQRLEDFLHIWEDSLLLAEALLHLRISHRDTEAESDLRGGVVNWSRLRGDLLSRRAIDERRFEIPERVTSSYLLNSPVISLLPILLSNWSRSSRRVYSLSADFQRSLELTSIGSITWNDVTFPFPSFAINLPISIPWREGEMSGDIDFLLVERTKEGVRIVSLGGNMNGRVFLSDERKRRIARDLHNHDFGRLRTYFAGISQVYYAMPATQYLTLSANNCPIMLDLDGQEFQRQVGSEMRPVEMSQAELPDFWKLIIRMVVGLCLHIELSGHASTKSTSRAIVSSWNKFSHPVTPDPRAITSEAQVCVVNTITALGPEEVQLHERIRAVGIREATRELPAQYRRAHWRRLPGHGDDPSAPRCVKVEAYMTGITRLPEQGLPGGSQVEIK